MPRAGDWTVDDLEHTPDDGLQYELLEGLLIVTPLPTPLHQRVIGNLHGLLAPLCPSSLEVFHRVAWEPDLTTSLQIDLLIARAADIGPRSIVGPPTIALEVLSPSTRHKDLLLKRSKYEDGGIASYWIVDPDAPSIEVLELVNGHYETVAFAAGECVASIASPFRVAVKPADLIRR